MSAGGDRKLDEPANRQYVEEDAAELRQTLAAWQLEKPDPDTPRTLNSPILKDNTIELMMDGYRELVAGFDDANVLWPNYRQHTTRRDVRQSVPALKLKEALAECQQVREYAQSLVADRKIAPDQELEIRRHVAHYLMGSIIIQAIMTAEAIGITPARVEKGFF